MIAEMTMVQNDAHIITAQPGEKQITLRNGYKVWTQASAEGSIPLLVLHGGPGTNHLYFESFLRILPPLGYQVIFHNQLGSYLSDNPHDPTLWTVERMRDEIEDVRQGLGLNKMLLYGFSCGGLLALEYALTYPKNLLGLVISNMPPSMGCYDTRLANLRKKFPAAVQEKLLELEQNGKTDSAEYKELVDTWLDKKNHCRIDPLPTHITKAMSLRNEEIHAHTFGTDPFSVQGTLKTWDRWAHLKNITIPTLCMGARYDIFDPEDIKKMASLIPAAHLFISESASHFPFDEDQENYFSALHIFFTSIRCMRAKPQ